PALPSSEAYRLSYTTLFRSPEGYGQQAAGGPHQLYRATGVTQDPDARAFGFGFRQKSRTLNLTRSPLSRTTACRLATTLWSAGTGTPALRNTIECECVRSVRVRGCRRCRSTNRIRRTPVSRRCAGRVRRCLPYPWSAGPARPATVLR